MAQSIIDPSHSVFLEDLKKRVNSSRYQAALKVNQELILLYHHIGAEILRSQQEHAGEKI